MTAVTGQTFRPAVLGIFFAAVIAAAVPPCLAQARTNDPVPKAGPPLVRQVDDAAVIALLKPRGKPLLVNFWATWCGPCRDEFPDLVRIDTDYAGKIDLLTVTLDDPADIKGAVPKFLAEMKASMPTYLLVSKDESALITSVAKDWTGGLPFTIVYGTDGAIAYFVQGKFKPDLVRTAIDKASAAASVVDPHPTQK